LPERWRQPFASSDAVRRRMSVQRREGTAPELAFRRALHALGLRYRLHLAPLPSLRRKADIVFRPERVAVFVDGCFWHGCPEHGRRAHEVNGWYWTEKIARNRQRDGETGHALAEAGWLAVRVWEHEVSGPEVALVAARVREALVARRPAGLQSRAGGHPGPGNAPSTKAGRSPK
jgi:DNA mismatch endonuclease, patch repair protein